MKKLSLILLFALLAFACKDATQENDIPVEENKTTLAVDSMVPSMDFATFESQYLTVESETVFVLNFWATWCKPCVKELPAFEELNQKYADKDVRVVLVSLDFPDKLEKGVIPFIERMGLKSEVILLDDPYANEWIPKVSESWSGAIPATVIVRNDKKQFYEQSFDYESLEKELLSFL